MTNYDKYADFIKEEMLERGNCMFGVTKNNEPKLCRKMECHECTFRGVDMTCQDFRRHWLNEEARGPITEQIVEAINECMEDCVAISCSSCTYADVRPRCMAGRIANTLNYRFDIKNKED